MADSSSGEREREEEEEIFIGSLQPFREGIGTKSTSSESGEISTSSASPARPSRAKRGRPPKRGRGGGRARRTDPVPSTSTGRGTVTAPGRGRGQGATKGRGRKRTLGSRLPKALSEEEANKIKEQQQQRRQQLKDMMASLSRDDLEEIVLDCCERSPALAMDIEGQLLDKSGQGPSHPQPPSTDQPDWCVCGRCRQMPTAPERKCCQQPGSCKSLDPVMEFNILNPFHLVIYRVIRGDYEGRDDDREEGEEDNASMRHAAYRSYIAWQFHKLTAGDRRVIPSCCVWRIRDRFPSPTGQYRGFLPGRRV